MVRKFGDLVELEIWMKGIGGPDWKALQVLGGTKFPHNVKQHFPETAPWQLHAEMMGERRMEYLSDISKGSHAPQKGKTQANTAP